LTGIFAFYNKIYYPALPIQSMSKREVVQKINNSDTKIISLAEENGQDWYIITVSNILTADELIKEMVEQHGWMLKQKEGNGLFFEKEGKVLIASTQMWTSNYIIVKIPEYFNE